MFKKTLLIIIVMVISVTAAGKWTKAKNLPDAKIFCIASSSPMSEVFIATSKGIYFSSVWGNEWRKYTDLPPSVTVVDNMEVAGGYLFISSIEPKGLWRLQWSRGGN